MAMESPWAWLASVLLHETRSRRCASWGGIGFGHPYRPCCSGCAFLWRCTSKQSPAHYWYCRFSEDSVLVGLGRSCSTHGFHPRSTLLVPVASFCVVFLPVVCGANVFPSLLCLTFLMLVLWCILLTIIRLLTWPWYSSFRLTRDGNGEALFWAQLCFATPTLCFGPRGISSWTPESIKSKTCMESHYFHTHKHISVSFCTLECTVLGSLLLVSFACLFLF